jgi:arsenate reductase (thioredoxin)
LRRNPFIANATMGHLNPFQTNNSMNKQSCFTKPFVTFLIAASICLTSSAQKKHLYAPLQNYLSQTTQRFDSIPQARILVLTQLANVLQTQLNKQHKASITFICTHNSRRSHMAQLLAAAAACYYGIEKVSCYSGGTQQTAFNIRAVNALIQAGFVIHTEAKSNDSNPLYNVQFSKKQPAMVAFSKKYTDSTNPSSNFIAVLTCSQADEACPIVTGATARIAIPYIDPKLSDNQPNETAIYRERCLQIATEMMYVFSLIKQ